MPLTHEPADHHGTPCLRFRNAGASALVALPGAQVLSWIPADGRERLFLGERAQFGAGNAIRGGIPVIFPQFGERGALRKHGFARLLDWTFAGIADGMATFTLHDGPATAEWPHAFACRLSLRLSATQLAIALEVENRGDATFDFTAALHTYLRVGDIAHAWVEGLQGCDYEDSANGGTLHRQHDYDVSFAGEVDRIYNDVVAPLALVDGTHRLDIEQDGFGDAVIWNPGAHLCARIADLAPHDWRRFACVEAGQVLQSVVLGPGECWTGAQRLG